VLVQHAPNIVRVIEKVDKRRAMRNSLDGKTAKIYPGVQSLHMRARCRMIFTFGRDFARKHKA
jgi:hypothetical protein